MPARMLKDFRYALRTLRQNPGFALTAILSISLGGALTMGRSELDPVNLKVLPLALLLITLIAAWIPARRASQISPLQALREE